MKNITLFCCALLAAAALQAQIIHVPGDYTTIQQGIDTANPGDTVLVNDGIYFEQINFLGKKPLMVASQFLMDGNATHVANTIIDGGLLPDPDSASVVYFVSGEDTTCVLFGFTIRNGRGTYTPDNLDDRQGGGIWISHSGAKIVHNRITHNVLNDRLPVQGNSTAGGGIGGRYEDGDHWVVITNNVIDSNMCISKYEYAAGAGIGLSYNSRIANNIISYNTCSSILAANSTGGGLWIGKDPAWTTPVLALVQQNTILGNTSQSESASYSGALDASAIKLVFIYNSVEYNSSLAGVTALGNFGGIRMLDVCNGSVAVNNNFMGNTSDLWTGGLHIENTGTALYDSVVLAENNFFLDNQALRGGALSAINRQVLLQNNVFSGNYASQLGGAVFLSNPYSVTEHHLARLINNSFSGNSAGIHGGAVYSQLARPLILNSVFYNDTLSGSKHEIYLTLLTDTVEIAYSNVGFDLVKGNIVDGGNNINADPLFQDPVTMTISYDSPCYNAGTDAFTCECGDTHQCPVYDILGYSRPWYGSFDIGAYEFHAPTGIRGISKDELRITSSPNPFTNSTVIKFSLDKPAVVHLTIMNGFGQQVAMPVSGYQQPGEHTVTWNAGDMPAGIYYYRIEAGGNMNSGKAVKL